MSWSTVRSSSISKPQNFQKNRTRSTNSCASKTTCHPPDPRQHYTVGKRSHPMKLHTITAALAMAGLGFAGATAHAQGISDDVIRIGFITDMSGVYSDIDGKAGLDAIRMA